MYCMRRSGHESAARAVVEALKRSDPTGSTVCLDPVAAIHPQIGDLIQHLYMTVIRRMPDVWGAVYDRPAVHRLTCRLRDLMPPVFVGKLADLVARIAPDVIICTQAYALMLAQDVRSFLRADIPLLGVVTDFRPHRFWVGEAEASYSVADDDSADILASWGVPSDRIRIHGIPVGPAFWELRPSVRQTPCRLLVMGGSRGLGIKMATFKHLDRSPARFVVDVLPGSNLRLRKRLAAAHDAFVHPLRIRPPGANVAARMSAASLLIGKPGGMTSAEALCAALPMLIVNPLPGQETRNAEVLTRQGCALQLSKESDLGSVVTALLSTPAVLRMMSEQARALARPKAALHIAAEVLRMAGH